MESIKGKFAELLKCLEDTIKPLTDQNLKFIESQRNIFYFTKFTIDPSNLNQIFNFIWGIKVSIFKKMLQFNKLVVRDALLFPQIPIIQERDKLLTLFSVCYIQYYSSFQYETNNSFEQFYNTNLGKILNNFHIIVKDENIFKSFAYQFFLNMHEEINNKKDMYKRIKALFKNYNPDIIHNHYEQQPIHKSLLTQLVAAKEHIVEMVFENNIKKKYNSKALQDDINMIINRLSKVVKESYLKEIANSSNPAMNTTIQHQNEEINLSISSKRLLSELIRCEVDPNIEKIIKDISNKVDETLLDRMINRNEKCTINIIQCFICYNIEIGTKEIREIPEYKDFTEDLTIKFIVPAKNIYNKFVEIYFSLYDLVYSDFNNLKYILDSQGLPAKFFNSAYLFGKSFADIMVTQKNNVQENMNEVINKFVELFNIEWEATIKENSKKLTHFCLI